MNKKSKYIFVNKRTLVRHHTEYMTDAELDTRNEWVRKNIGEHMSYMTEEYYEELLNPPKEEPPPDEY